MSVLVSINCITYNHEDYISDAIEGFLMQKTDFDFEILIGEDCSTDNTRKIVERYIERYPDKISLITSETNIGAKKNARRLQGNSKGKYIAVCEGDDYWTDPLKLQKQVDYMEHNEGCTLCFHSAEIVTANKRKIGMQMRSYCKNTVCPMEDIIIGGGGFCPTQSIMYLKRTMDNLPEFHTKAPVGDYPMQMIVASQGYAYYIDENMSAYRNAVKGSWTERTKTIEKSVQVFEKLVCMLSEFDEYTNYKYSKAVDKAKLNIKCQMLLLQGKLKELKSLDGEYYTQLGKKTKMKVYARCAFPKIYEKLVNIKGRIRSFIYNICKH